MKHPAVSVIVPCRNEKKHIESALRSILAQDPPAGDFEVIVADGMSDDGTRDILKRLEQIDSRLRIVDNPGRIVSTGLNTAIRAARGELVIRMDAHTVFAEDYVRQCVATSHQTGADNVGGPWVVKGSSLIARAIAAVFECPFGTGAAKGHDRDYTGLVDTVYLGCWPRDVFERCGMFDEELVRNQDDDFNLRLSRSGGKVWQSPNIRSSYCPRESLPELFAQYSQYGYWKVRILQKHKIPASFRHLVPGAFVFTLLALALLLPLSSVAGWLWLTLVIAYLIGVKAASLFIARREGWKLFPLVPVVFACYHFAYGWGFLRGMFDFVILRRGACASYTRLTRSQIKNATPYN
jgi:succinoglycan biosynthesis protein ExoA